MSKNFDANINLKTFKKLIDENEDKLDELEKILPDLDDVLASKRQMSLFELNKVARLLKTNMISLYLTPEVYTKAYGYYKVVHQCKKLEEKGGFMNEFGIHITKEINEFLLEEALYCPYCGFKIEK